jgi:quinol monooxygenase YgiN
MHLVTFTFDVHREDRDAFVEQLESLKAFWERQGISYALYQDKTQNTRFLQTLLTDRSVEEITKLIRQDPQIKSVFELIKSAAGHVTVSFLDRVV